MPKGNFQIQINHAFSGVIVMIFKGKNLPILKELVWIISAPRWFNLNCRHIFVVKGKISSKQNEQDK